jgi:phosphoglycolate phosphatase
MSHSQNLLSEAELVIFDWDGTLVDSRGVIVATMQAALREVGAPPMPDEEVQQIIGLGLNEAVRTLLPDASEETCSRLRESYGQRFKSYTARDMPFFPGAETGLDRLLGKGKKLAVATGKSRRGLDRMLGEWGLEDTFLATRCADETASKPHPRMLEELLHVTGTETERAVLVGDTAFDMEMAHRLGMPRVAVTYGVHSRERLAPWAPHAWAAEFPEVLAHLGCADLDPEPVEGYN